MDEKNININSIQKINAGDEVLIENLRPNMTYIQDVWRRLKKNKLSIIGLITIAIIAFLALFSSYFSDNNYYEQDLSMTNIPPVIMIYPFSETTNLYVHSEYTLFEVSTKGELIKRYELQENNILNKTKIYNIEGKEVVVDFKNAAVVAKLQKEGEYSKARKLSKFKIIIEGSEYDLSQGSKSLNKKYIFGTDYLGRDLYTRVMYGARISLLIALIATIVQFFIGVIYGGIAGYFGGKVDNLMMRFVDIIATVPLTLYVVLLMVILGAGIKTIIIAIGSVYWVSMARLVRGQVLTIKSYEFVLAAKTIGTSTAGILRKHLVPNAMGAIIVSLTMNIPSAIFLEAFLSFIGLGVSAPAASWGTLANDAIGGLRTYPYQLFFPALFICLTVLAFNFLGDGLRDALDPKLRK